MKQLIFLLLFIISSAIVLAVAFLPIIVSLITGNWLWFFLYFAVIPAVIVIGGLLLLGLKLFIEIFDL